MDVMAAIESRRSIRRYKDLPVEKEKVRRVLEAACMAPSASNSQPWDFIVIDDPDMAQRVASLFLSAYRKVYQEVVPLSGDALEQRLGEREAGVFQKVPVYVVVCLNQGRCGFERHPEKAFFWALQGVSAAIQNMLLAAFALGLGTCWMSALAFEEAELKKLLHIPDAVRILGGIPIGYPDESPQARPRLGLSRVAHFNQW